MGVARDVYDEWQELAGREEQMYDEDVEPLNDDEHERLAYLQGIIDTLSETGCRDDMRLIPEEEQPDYAREYAEGLRSDLDEWPCNRIDWAEAADDLFTDFSTVDIDGTTYWYQEW